MKVDLPQHRNDALIGDAIDLEESGEFSINKFDGLTVLTKAQAREVAAMLIEWANRPAKQ